MEGEKPPKRQWPFTKLH